MSDVDVGDIHVFLTFPAHSKDVHGSPARCSLQPPHECQPLTPALSPSVNLSHRDEVFILLLSKDVAQKLQLPDYDCVDELLVVPTF